MRKNYTKKLLTYSAAAAAMPLTQDLQAQIIHHDIDPDHSFVSPEIPMDVDENTILYFDADMDGTADLTFRSSFNYYEASPLYSNLFRFTIFGPPGKNNGVIKTPGGDIAKLNNGYLIDNTDSWINFNVAGANMMSASWYYSNFPDELTSNGNIWFNDATDKYIGFRFKIDGAYHYGWMRLSTSLNPGVTPQMIEHSIIIKDYAYDATPNNPIVAGDMGLICDAPAIDGTYNIMATSAKLKWFAVDGATKYQLKFREVGAPTWTKLNITGTQKTITGLSCNVNYEWSVKARCGDLFSAFSPLQTFTTAVCKVGELSSTEIDVYPNPASDAVYLDLQGFEATSIVAISDINGKQMASDFIIEDGIMQVDIHNYPSGVYLMQIQTSSTVKTIKFVKQ